LGRTAHRAPVWWAIELSRRGSEGVAQRHPGRTPLMKKIATLVAATGLAFGLTACGADNGPEEAVNTFGEAVADKDYKTVCETLDPEIVDQLEQLQEGKD